MDKDPYIEKFLAEATEWAKNAEQCSCCHAWAILDKSGHCPSCPTTPHKHPDIVINFEMENQDDPLPFWNPTYHGLSVE